MAREGMVGPSFTFGRPRWQPDRTADYAAVRYQKGPGVEKTARRALQPDPLPASRTQKLSTAGAPMNRLRFSFVLSSTIAAFACGGISDPTLGSGTERVATVSGALTGTAVP